MKNWHRIVQEANKAKHNTPRSSCKTYHKTSPIYNPGPVFTKGLSQGLGLKLRLLSQVSAQKLLS